MFSAPATASVAAGHAALIAASFLLFGYLIVDCFTGSRDLHWTVRWGLAFPAVVAFALALMVLHILSGGELFSRPPLVRVLTVGFALVAVAVRLRRGRRRQTSNRNERVALISLVALGVVLWAWPVTQSLPLPHGPDIKLHMGWATQLLNGESTPSATITGDIPNYYPWMYHGVVATLATFTPGDRAFHALGPLQLLQVTGAVLILFALGRQLTGKWVAGGAAALFGALMGGVGYVLASGPAVVHPRAEEGGPALDYLGDLVFVRSYSFPFQNLAPPGPRNLSFTLLLSFLLLLTMGLQRKSGRALLWGGFVLGLTGLAGAEAFFVGVAIVVAASLAPIRLSPLPRRKVAAALALPAAAVYALWLVPIVAGYFRLGGFVDITRVESVALPPHAILVAWGVATPFALYAGVRRLRGHGRDEMRMALVVLASAAALLLLAGAIPRLFGEPFQALGRHHRYWPLAHLGVVLAGAIGACDLFERLRRANQKLAVATAAAITAAAIPSPLLASLALPDELPPEPLLAAALRGRSAGFLDLVSPVPGRPCTAAAGPRLGLMVFGYTGYRFVRFGRTAGHNAARVRWRDIYDHVPRDAERESANRVLVGGQADRDIWEQTARKYDVDVVILPLWRSEPPVLEGMRHQVAAGPGGRVAVVHIGDCAAEGRSVQGRGSVRQSYPA